MKFGVGSLVRARGRSWVVLPESAAESDLLVLRPLGGSEEEITGIYLPLEEVRSDEFPPPDPERELGNHLSCSLLRDAVRLGFRSGAGPFRSLGKIRIEPRPYQLVPLLMALKLDPVRLLIADDVGVGKTIEACLIARELMDRGDIQRFTVLCPPHLAEQWQRALEDQFHIEAQLVLSSTAARLEREGDLRESIFERHPVTVVSTDFIKQEHRREDFLRVCPELVIVDEAHGCGDAGGRGAAQQRHELLKKLAAHEKRNLILVTATPHSGNQETFRSLLGLLDPSLVGLPEDLGGEANRKQREHLARHFIQRRRGDLTAYMAAHTPFPDRDPSEEHYSLKENYRRFFDRVLAYCRETVLDQSVDQRRQRVRWWSALALLRALSSSPAAAAATLRNRSRSAQAETVDGVDAEGQRAVLDLDEESAEGMDVAPGAQETDDEASAERKRLLELAREVEGLAGKDDAKLQRAETLVKKLVADGYSPIVFCRFIPTVGYVAEALRKKLGQDVVVEAIDGQLPPDEREKRVEALAAHGKRVLVCTDCLSEGINLQQSFDAVLHYDLSWNPTRHEQREGRVDRYGQRRDQVRAITFYGNDNPVDGIVLEVLLRKHRAIRKSLGILVPVPLETKIVERAILEGLLLRDTKTAAQTAFDFLEPVHREMDAEWDTAVEREKKSRSLFAQHQLQKAVAEELVVELEEVRRAIGGPMDVERFTRSALAMHGARVVDDGKGIDADVRESPAALRDAMGAQERVRAVFEERAPEGAALLTRTHPVVTGLATHVLEAALDPTLGGAGKRCGVIRTRAVTERTTLILLRLRFHIVTRLREGTERPLLAEDHALVAFAGNPEAARWLEREQAEALLAARPDVNTPADIARPHLKKMLDQQAMIEPHLRRVSAERGAALLEAHQRVRKAAKTAARALKVDALEPTDVLGLFIYLPVAAA